MTESDIDRAMARLEAQSVPSRDTTERMWARVERGLSEQSRSSSSAFPASPTVDITEVLDVLDDRNQVRRPRRVGRMLAAAVIALVVGVAGLAVWRATDTVTVETVEVANESDNGTAAQPIATPDFDGACGSGDLLDIVADLGALRSATPPDLVTLRETINELLVVIGDFDLTAHDVGLSSGAVVEASSRWFTVRELAELARGQLEASDLGAVQLTLDALVPTTGAALESSVAAGAASCESREEREG